jgi:ATP adenylyltransferase/5',5'''-P-1,P-4-tetraphosphate phosphorylase II
MAVGHGCTSRVVKIDGHQLIVTADYNTRRVDLTLQHHIVTEVNLG